jgi:hypothetical protein
MCTPPTGDLELPDLGSGRLVKPREDWEEVLSDELSEVLSEHQQTFEGFRVHGYVAWLSDRAIGSACPDIRIPLGRWGSVPLSMPCVGWELLRWLSLVADGVTIVGAILGRSN